MLERQGPTVVERKSEVGSQRLVDQHLPYPCKDLTPAALAVSHIAFLVEIIPSAVRHQVVVSTMEEAFLNAPKVISKALNFRSSLHIGRHGFSPFSHRFLKREAPFPVKHRVKSRSPAFRKAWAATTMVAVSKKELVEPSTWTWFHFVNWFTAVPSKLVQEIPG